MVPCRCEEEESGSVLWYEVEVEVHYFVFLIYRFVRLLPIVVHSAASSVLPSHLPLPPVPPVTPSLCLPLSPCLLFSISLSLSPCSLTLIFYFSSPTVPVDLPLPSSTKKPSRFHTLRRLLDQRPNTKCATGRSVARRYTNRCGACRRSTWRCR